MGSAFFCNRRISWRDTSRNIFHRGYYMQWRNFKLNFGVFKPILVSVKSPVEYRQEDQWAYLFNNQSKAVGVIHNYVKKRCQLRSFSTFGWPKCDLLKDSPLQKKTEIFVGLNKYFCSANFTGSALMDIRITTRGLHWKETIWEK